MKTRLSVKNVEAKLPISTRSRIALQRTAITIPRWSVKPARTRIAARAECAADGPDLDRGKEQDAIPEDGEASYSPGGLREYINNNGPAYSEFVPTKGA